VRAWFLRPAWLALHLAVVAAAVLCAVLGAWQLDRARAQHAESLAPSVNATRPPVPLDDLLAPGTLIRGDAVGRRVVVSGEYDLAGQLLVPDREVDGTAGVAVLTPLVVSEGVAVVVDRGFLPTADQRPTADIPDPPRGEVSVAGWLVASEDAPPTDRDPPPGEIDAIHLPSLVNLIDHPLYDGFVRAAPDPSSGLTAEPPPGQLTGGTWPLRNIAYAIQWWFFGLAALAFWVAVVRRGPAAPIGVDH
jgi:cytochrome oxidase assembly protein ShyY1